MERIKHVFVLVFFFVVIQCFLNGFYCWCYVMSHDFRHTTVFTVEDETRTIEVHSQAVILFIPQIPDLEDHLVSYLQSFFYTYEKFGLELAKLREAEKDG